MRTVHRIEYTKYTCATQDMFSLQKMHRCMRFCLILTGGNNGCFSKNARMRESRYQPRLVTTQLCKVICGYSIACGAKEESIDVRARDFKVWRVAPQAPIDQSLEKLFCSPRPVCVTLLRRLCHLCAWEAGCWHDSIKRRCCISGWAVIANVSIATTTMSEYNTLFEQLIY